MNALEAAIQVLKNAKKSLHVDEITKLMLEAGLWESTSKTPATSVGAQLSKEIKKNGHRSLIVRVAPQTFNLLGFDHKAIGIDAMSMPLEAKVSAVDAVLEKTPLEALPLDKPLVEASTLVKLESPMLMLQVPNANLRDIEVISQVLTGGTGTDTFPRVEVPTGKVYVEKLYRENLYREDVPQELSGFLSSKTSFSLVDCALKVLELFADKKPMHYRAIIEKALRKGWLLNDVNAPEASMSAEVLNENKRRQARGERCRFIQHSGGYLGLSQWEEDNVIAKDKAQALNAAVHHDEKSGHAQPLTKAMVWRDLPLESEGNESHRADKTSTVATSREEPKSIRIGEGYSFSDCAEKVLEAYGDKRPMQYRDISKIAIEMGWLLSEDKMDVLSMSTAINNENKRRQKRGDCPRFIQYGQVYLGLSSWENHRLPAEIEAHNQALKTLLQDQLMILEPAKFESLVILLLEAMGFAFQQLRTNVDGGIHARGYLVVGDVIRVAMVIQLKRTKDKTQASAVRQLRASLNAHEQGLIMTTSDFSQDAQDEAARPDTHPIALLNGKQLAVLLMEYKIGVQRSAQNLFEINKDFFVEA